MNWSQGGDFTKSLLSLQLQLQTLLEGVGGEETAGLLDALAKLNDTERSVVIPVLLKVVARFAASDQRLTSEEDLQLQDFENSLYESVLSAMGEVSQGGRDASRKLELVPGGKHTDTLALKKPVRIPALIDLSKARETRKQQRYGIRTRDSV